MKSKCKPIITPEVKKFQKCIIQHGGPNPHLEHYGGIMPRHQYCQNESQAAIRSIKAHVKMIGSGAYRTVFDLGDRCVLKIAKDLAGADSNRIEWTVWQRVKKNKELRKCFAPMVAADDTGAWLIAKKAQEIGSCSLSSENKLFAILKKFGIPTTGLDFQGENIGVFGRRGVILDYGFEMLKGI